MGEFKTVFRVAVFLVLLATAASASLFYDDGSDAMMDNPWSTARRRFSDPKKHQTGFESLFEIAPPPLTTWERFVDDLSHPVRTFHDFRRDLRNAFRRTQTPKKRIDFAHLAENAFVNWPKERYERLVSDLAELRASAEETTRDWHPLDDLEAALQNAKAKAEAGVDTVVEKGQEALEAGNDAVIGGIRRKAHHAAEQWNALYDDLVTGLHLRRTDAKQKEKKTVAIRFPQTQSVTESVSQSLYRPANGGPVQHRVERVSQRTTKDGKKEELRVRVVNGRELVQVRTLGKGDKEWKVVSQALEDVPGHPSLAPAVDEECKEATREEVSDFDALWTTR